MQLVYGDDYVDARTVRCRWDNRCKNDKLCSLICVTKFGKPVTTISKSFTGNGFMN